ncbi:2OG-Fe(II) oxygenase [Pseudomonas sp. RTC3]|uniref:HalD/BesD family halogenase n=1 Tax=unclassified Pseudomonas TaxID=196821 RepID=UPI002AB3B724|nr:MULTISPECIES: 2OG-Fe(II) oxygenase [unclassified Pseudomonas]MEB0064256.1 2OG-Fe(II) oxygenase [Pseudomonas sp. RTC3]MDY7567976.1 2OG-Fe(II) oxygenase [Pseudomonas sp. 5C2]MEB0008902.1 2OG-Fe(II) oxygenase [Pseudomonas sp. RTB2]MEB0017639.1 2OG-Fe(II) oxygenase [Pseudomonas sp. RTB3]MEB0148562.1 2OG-Fe(II) oxygenase [Pseudomonas sp. CCC2.2]
MKDILDLERYPLDQEGSPQWQAAVDRAAVEMQTTGMFNLNQLMKPQALKKATAEIKPVMDSQSHAHKRRHNIYFQPDFKGLDPKHPALREVESTNHTLCADQIVQSTVLAIYEYPPLLRFIAAVMGKPTLHVMEDPLARANVMSYREGEALNWHFDRCEFTTTLLLQEPLDGGKFQYRSNLRTAENPNYEGIAAVLDGRDPDVKTLTLEAGTLNVFRGVNSLHRVTPVQGSKERMIAIFSYYENTGVMFSDEESIGFYGRAS